MQNIPISDSIITQALNQTTNPDLGTCTIREIVAVANTIEQLSDISFIRLEMGIPGINAPTIGINAEIEALNNGVASKYPPIEGVNSLKTETASFIKNFIGVNIQPTSCIPTVGSMQGAYIAFMLVNNFSQNHDTVLFIDPGFSVQKTQLKVLGYKYNHFDVYNYRGTKLHNKLEQYCSQGNISSIVYSNPNNPSWICLTNDELKTIAEIANKYNITVIEDLAYFGMDFRTDISIPGQPPYQPSVANYTNNYIILLSGSKAFSYAGQRIAMLCIADNLFNSSYSQLEKRFGTKVVGYTAIHRLLYTLSSGVCHSSQHALAAMLKAANNGGFNFIDNLKIYGDKAKIIKQMFTQNGFHIVYDNDNNTQIADGFYFTVAYNNMHSSMLLKNLLYYGISAIGLINCGSNNKNGIRVCVSQVKPEQYNILNNRLKQFNTNFTK